MGSGVCKLRRLYIYLRHILEIEIKMWACCSQSVLTPNQPRTSATHTPLSPPPPAEYCPPQHAFTFLGVTQIESGLQFLQAGVVLQDMEEAAAALGHSIDASRKDKGQLLADIVDTEKQVTRTYTLPVSTLLLPLMLFALNHSLECWLMTAVQPR